MKSCFFIGHSEIFTSISDALEKEIERHITDYSVREFIVGTYGDFDRLTAHALYNAKKRHPGIVLLCLSPYHPADRRIQVPEGFDSLFYPPIMENVPKRYAIVRANRYMIDTTDYLIAYVWKAASNSREILEYALKREKRGLIHVTQLYTVREGIIR